VLSPGSVWIDPLLLEYLLGFVLVWIDPLLLEYLFGIVLVDAAVQC